MSARELITEHLDLWTGAVTHKSSAGRGRNGKIELTGIKKLRELILELAVRGKLVEQDPSDEPASVLLERIAEEKARLVKEGKIRKPRKLPPLTDTNKPFSLPERWEWSQIEAVGHDWGQKEPDQAFSYIDVSAVDNIKGIIKQPETISPINAPSRARKKVRPNTVIYSTVRPYLQNIAVVEDQVDPEPIASTAFAIVSPLCGVPARYLLHYLRSPVFVRYVESVQTGIAYPAINDKQFFSGALPVPPLKEQHRIVEKVDELMALCDRLEQQVGDQLEAHDVLADTLLDALTRSADATEVAENWARIAEYFDTLFTTESSIDKLKQAILQLAVMGRLVEQDPNDEPASVLLEKIAEEKARLVKEGNYRKQKSLGEIEREESLYSTPANWEWGTIDSISIVQGGIQKQPKRAPKQNHYPYLRVADVQRGALSDCSELPRFELSYSEIEQYKLNDADILIVEGNGSSDEIGRCAIWDGRISNCVYQNHLIRVRPAYQELSQFIALFLNSPSGIEEMKRLAVTTSGLYNLSVGKIRNIMIPIAPLEEQHRIVEKVDELMALCDQLKAHLGEAGETRVHLAEAVVEGGLN